MDARPQLTIVSWNAPYGKNFVFLNENLNEIVPKLRSQ